MEDLVLVRLTNIEFDKVLNMGVGEVFNHVNLLHGATMMRVDSSKFQYGIRIVKNGVYGNGDAVNTPPELDYSKLIKLELLNIKDGFEVKGNYDFENLLLHDDRGIVESLYARYHPVIGITKGELLDMKFYVRRFRILAF